MSSTSLGTLITYNPWAVGPTTLLDDVAAQFDELGVHHVAVVDGQRRVIGMLSETDLLRARQSRRAVLVGSGVSDTDDAPLVFARDAMKRDVMSIGEAAGFRTALRLLLDGQIHALPVVEENMGNTEQRLVGMVSSRDFLREFSYGDLPASRQSIAKLLPATPPQTLSPEATLDEALLTMQEAGVTCLGVAQGESSVGIISQRDIVREKCRVEEQAEFHPETRPSTAVRGIARLSPPLKSNQRLFEAASAMIQHGLPAVAVFDQANRLLGMITEDDLLRVLYDALA
jgi:CBS domain-containing protein